MDLNISHSLMMHIFVANSLFNNFRVQGSQLGITTLMN